MQALVIAVMEVLVCQGIIVGEIFGQYPDLEIYARIILESIKNVITDGKLRLSYGVNGTQPSTFYSYMINMYRAGQIYNGQSGMGVIGIGSPDLKWEKNKAF